MDVTQPDGQVLAAHITKLTDQSTYTVGELASTQELRNTVEPL